MAIEPEPISKVLSQISEELKTHTKVLILGIGENRMGDDGAGPLISFELSKRFSHPNLYIINGGIVPEERLEEILEFQPDLLIVIDAIDAGLPLGQTAWYDEKRMLNYLPISSHSMPLPVFMDRIKRGIEGVKIKLLGIQPISLAFRPKYALYNEEEYSLDDKDENLNIPFYAFNLSPEMDKICADLLEGITKELNQKFK